MKPKSIILAALAWAFLAAQPVRPEQPLPPVFPDLRVAAEWEPAIGVLIGWPLKLPRCLVEQLAKDVCLYVTVCGEQARLEASQTFTGWGIDPAQVQFITTAQGDGYYLTRDWGPLARYDAQGDQSLVNGCFCDYMLERWTGHRTFRLTSLTRRDYALDNVASAAVAQVLNERSTHLRLALTGGNLLFDGVGTAFCTQILIDENESRGFSCAAFRCILKKELGIDRLIVVPNFERFGIQHIDCFCKLLDEHRILVRRLPAHHPGHAINESAARHLVNCLCATGRPYEILRIETPCYLGTFPAAYTNALILNRKIYVPLFGIPADQLALQTYRQAMPGYEVLGISSKNWNFTDAIHCRVRAVWDPMMLRLTHQRVVEQGQGTTNHIIEMAVQDCSRAGLVEEKLQLAYRQQGNVPWTTIKLQRSGSNSIYRGTIPAVKPGTTVEYYLSAASQSGRQETLPRTAPLTLYSFSTPSASPSME